MKKGNSNYPDYICRSHDLLSRVLINLNFGKDTNFYSFIIIYKTPKVITKLIYFRNNESITKELGLKNFRQLQISNTFLTCT